MSATDFWTITSAHVVTWITIGGAAFAIVRAAWQIGAAVTALIRRLEHLEELVAHTHECIESVKEDIKRLDERWHNFITRWLAEK